MKVKLKKATWYQGELHKIGSVLELPQDIGESWIKRGIADSVDEPDEQPKMSRKKKVEQE